jgi:hypothetical protein
MCYSRILICNLAANGYARAIRSHGLAAPDL